MLPPSDRDPDKLLSQISNSQAVSSSYTQIFESFLATEESNAIAQILQNFTESKDLLNPVAKLASIQTLRTSFKLTITRGNSAAHELKEHQNVKTNEYRNRDEN